MPKEEIVGDLFGTELTEADYRNLERCWIDAAAARQAGLRRVSGEEPKRLLRRSGDCSGILIPYVWPGEDGARYYRVRLDSPVTVVGTGTIREERYVGMPGSGRMLYIVPGTPSALPGDIRVPVIITDGEERTIALSRLASHAENGVGEPIRFLPIGLRDAWGWHAKVIGDGNRLIKGPIADLDRLTWLRRRVYVAVGRGGLADPIDVAGRDALSNELRRRGADVFWVDVPPEAGVDGLDGLLAEWGRERVLDHIGEAARAEI
jgi:hypothetical protein